MAKKAILEVLESTIGRYVSNLDAESLNVAVWSGKIELQSLQLDIDAVNNELSRRAHEAPNLASPFRVCAGQFDSVQLDVPWARLSSRPVIFRAKGLYVHTEPHDFLSEDRTYANRWGTKVKSKKDKRPKNVDGERQQSIARAEESRKRASAVRMAWDGDEEEDGNDKATDSSTFTSRLVRRIIENLQVEVNDVHIAVKGYGCAAGLILGSLSLSTTDSSGNRTFVDRKTNVKNPASSFLFKELRISGLGIYLQHDRVTQNTTRGSTMQNAEYLLEPLSFQARLRQSDLDRCVDFPKYLIHSKLSSLSIQLTRDQLELGQRLAAVVKPNSEIRPLFPEYRPTVPLRGNAKQWWRYAMRCVGRLNRYRSWIEYFVAFQKRKIYIDLYKRQTYAEESPWLAKITPAELTQLKQIENDRSISVAGIMHWRTISDAQAFKEDQKHQMHLASSHSESFEAQSPTRAKSSMRKTSYLAASSLFNTPKTPKKDLPGDLSYSSLVDDDENSEKIPITLTADELKELEALAIETAESKLSKDSILCDVNFNLGSFQVNLLKSSRQPLTSLEMGMVSASFKANADGSFVSSLSLLSLEIVDSVTIDTFYPTVCRSLQKAHSNMSRAFHFQATKNKDGDQEFVLKMVACEIVASPLLLFAVRDFFKLPDRVQRCESASNPIVYESVSGDEDVFYDAKGGSSTVLMSMHKPAPTTRLSLSANANALHKDGKVSDKISSAIVDAWNGKNQQKQHWKMDFDISAPILILPANCVDPNAEVLMCNFGQFTFTYGSEALSPAVTDWFNSNPRSRKLDSEIDHLRLVMSNLSFTIDTLGNSSGRIHDEKNFDASTSVIEPVSFTLDIGLEHTVSSRIDTTPRTCVVGVLPGIQLRLGPSHVTKMLSVAGIWTSNLSKLRGESQPEAPILLPVNEECSDPDLEIMSSSSGISILDAEAEATSPVRSESILSKKNRLESMLVSRQQNDDSNAFDFVHISLSLLRLSVNLYTSGGDGVEAHLVSVVVSSSLSTDGRSTSRLSMGWFWILDQLASDQQLPRRQRLLCYSNLPRAATEYAEDNRYGSILDDLTSQGVFKPDYTGSSDLADVEISKLPAAESMNYHDSVPNFSRGYMQTLLNIDKVTVITAKFTSLFINWNPSAIKTLFAAKSSLLDFKARAYSTYERMSNLQQEARPTVVDQNSTSPAHSSHSIFILAQMDSLEISLNSAKDDLPLFTLTMSGSKVNHHNLEGDDNNSELNLEVGDFRLQSASYGKTLDKYRTILGLAPTASTSLLSVKYFKGSNAVHSCEIGGNDKLECEACGEIRLSPMRFVHVHAQVFTLIEYVTEGFFGAISASVASSAALALEAARATSTVEKLFFITASGFDFVLPQAAYSAKHFAFHAGSFTAKYRSHEGNIGSEASVSLQDVSLSCGQKMPMVASPVSMSITVRMKPPFSPGSEDERATRVDVSISRIRLLIARTHYAQAMHTIDYNVSEHDAFLREAQDRSGDGRITVNTIIQQITHAGVEYIEVIKRMYINFHIAELAVELCSKTTDDPIISLAAVNTTILMKLLPDQKQTKAQCKLHDLVCDDRRPLSTDRTFRRMIGRSSTDVRENEVFLLNYSKNTLDDSRNIEAKLGSSQVILLPDLIFELLHFIKIAPLKTYKSMISMQSLASSVQPSDTGTVQVVLADDGPDEVEACFGSVPGPAQALKRTTYRMESDNMRLVLVDLGNLESSGPFASTKKNLALTETIVVQGQMQANFEMVNERASNFTVEKDYKVDAERVEIYTAQGSDLLHPVQILEPAKFSCFYYQKIDKRKSSHLTDIKLVTLSPIDLVVSMQNAALASTVISCLSDSLSGDDLEDESPEFRSLSTQDANRIARLDSALEKEGNETSSGVLTEHSIDPSYYGDGKGRDAKRVVRLKMTSPEATLTVTNDFQGLDEALFKIIAMNCVFGGEVSYSTLNDKPCFGCNLNTSILADYFDSASNRWENLLTMPWELTFNSSRAPQTKVQSSRTRMSTTFDIESNPCHVSFSEHFLVNVGAASRMWSVYSGASKKATSLVEETSKDDSIIKRRLSRSMAAHAARSLITTLPYAIENHCGIDSSYSIYKGSKRYPLPPSSTQYFRFELFPERGSGGMRTYGQDTKHPKSVTIYIGDTEIRIKDMDGETSKSRKSHFIPSIGVHIFVEADKRGNSTVLHLSSHVEIHSSAALPFRIAVIEDDKVHDLGLITKPTAARQGSKSLLEENEDVISQSVIGIPAYLLRDFAGGASESLCVQISPVLDESGVASLIGMFNLPPMERLVEIATSYDNRRLIEVTCSPISRGGNIASLSFNVRCDVSLINNSRPFVNMTIEPRLILQNRLPVSVLLRTPMPYTFASSAETNKSLCEDTNDSNETTHVLLLDDSVEIYTPGPSIAVSMRCADLPVGGTSTGWVDNDSWIDIPLSKGRKILEPIQCVFPFERKSIDRYDSSRRHRRPAGVGNFFYVLEAEDVTPDLRGESSDLSAASDTRRTVVFIVTNYAVDHTGNLLFEEVFGQETDSKTIRRSSSSRSVSGSWSSRGGPPFSCYSSSHHRRRVSLLPDSSSYIRLVHLTMDGEEGMKRSVSFKVDDVSMTEGIDAMPILWQDMSPSGYYAYRRLTSEGSEVHFVPEYVIFNGSQHHEILVKQLGCSPPFHLEPNKIAPISRDRNDSIVVQFEVPAISGLTGPVQIDKIGLRICVAKSKVTGEPLGSLAVQTVAGGRDSRLVIKIGAINIRENAVSMRSSKLFKHDFIRFRVRWTEMRVTLKDTEESNEKYEENRAAIRKYLEHHNVNSAELERKLAEARRDYNMGVENRKKKSFPDVSQILLHRFTVDFQRIFKDENVSSKVGLPSSERAQFSVVVHNVRIIDCSPSTESPVVFDSMSEKSFFDLCVRTRGPLNADLIRVDLFDLNLAYGDGKAEKIVVNTGEDFVWRLLDIANRTALATAELAGVDLDLEWDEEVGKFKVSVLDSIAVADDVDADGNYRPPRSDKLFDVKKLRVSPFTLLLSFKRQPQSSRYQLIRGVKGAKLTNYFTTRLKFTIDRADLRFKGYMVRDIKGPPDRLADTVKAVYTTQLKTKMVTLMTATSVQDWKYLTARESGGEEFIEGDLLRMTGNLAGRSAKFVLKKSGDYIGDSLVNITGTIGGGIQEATEQVGLGQVGAGVNSIVSGLGEGVSSSVKGVGTGAGDILRGAGKGLGQVVGGLGGGVQQVGKGIARGVTTGDASDIGQGFQTMGQGIGTGFETAVEGTVSGVFSVGKGLFGGVKSVGQGIGGVFGQGPQDKNEPNRRGPTRQHRR